MRKTAVENYVRVSPVAVVALVDAFTEYCMNDASGQLQQQKFFTAAGHWGCGGQECKEDIETDKGSDYQVLF